MFAPKKNPVSPMLAPLLLRGSNFYLFSDLYCIRIGINALFALLMKEGGKERAFRPIRVQYRFHLSYKSVISYLDI